MRILLSHRYFWPDSSPYALMLRDIGVALADAGHEVHVLGSSPSYRMEGSQAAAPRRELHRGLHVRRIWVLGREKSSAWRRIVNAALYSIALFVTVLRVRPDVVTASTFPPVASAWMASLAARLVGARFVYHLQDIHPEVSILSGSPLGRGLVASMLRVLDNQTLRRSALVVVLSSDMADTVAARGISHLPIRILNNFALESLDGTEAPPPHLCKSAGRRRVIFAGNLGRFQNLHVLTEGVARVLDEHPNLELLFLGDGTELPELKRRWGSHPQVVFGPFLPFAQAKCLIAQAEVGLVSLQKGLHRVAYPSKLFTYLALGVPVLALVEAESCIASTIRAERLGSTVSGDDANEVADALRAMLESDADTREIRASWVREHATATALLPQWVELIESLVESLVERR